VLNKSGKVGGDHRIPEFEILLGDSTLTTHAEYGYRYRLNVREVFFNSRLGFERRRVMAQVNPGENILVPFCGVGPFAIPAASRGARVVAVEKNPAACKWLAENIRLNNVRVDILCADASVLPFCLKTGFDRLIVPTPYGMDRFFDLLSPLLRPGGFMHFYTFGVEGDVRVRRKEFAGKGYEVRQVRRCGNVAAGVSRWVFDLRKHIEQE
jgi:tRNA (guanine37-N1)-methyltransferase